MFPLMNEWSLKNLGIHLTLPEAYQNQSLVISKSISQATLSFEAVYHMFNVLNLTIFLDTVNGHNFEHELATSTLNANEILGIPGGFTTRCLFENPFGAITRFSKWAIEPKDKKHCLSGNIRHGICILGMWDMELLT
ncbi:unnamed protein product [Bursaphelenchus okinawaensis]|uniref:Uncharacterized protein n=1 Tax=Bursaphelenchus okinawaensis TaxID=465554 RepID=A0A811KBL0_9BILA|nr:unnamed protein product [Bursaphelenchus okinawaensis]CAG9101034.1 unnamed protein product [Bursaphelenchus okinawaensis]